MIAKYQYYMPQADLKILYLLNCKGAKRSEEALALRRPPKAEASSLLFAPS